MRSIHTIYMKQNTRNCHEVPGLAKEDNGESKGNVTQYVPRYILGEATKLPSCRVKNNILATKC